MAKKMAGPPVRTAKIKILKGVCLGPNEDAEPGDVYELPKHLATDLVHQKLAEYTTEGEPLKHDETEFDAEGKPKPKGVPGDEYKTVTVEGPTSRDPKPAKRK